MLGANLEINLLRVFTFNITVTLDGSIAHDSKSAPFCIASLSAALQTSPGWESSSCAPASADRSALVCNLCSWTATSQTENTEMNKLAKQTNKARFKTVTEPRSLLIDKNTLIALKICHRPRIQVYVHRDFGQW